MAERTRFDAFCLQQTLAAGLNGGAVTLRKVDSFLALDAEPGGVGLEVSFTGSDGTARAERLRAAVLIGADGSNGQTRRMAAAIDDAGENATALSGGPDPLWYTRGFALEALVPYTALPTPLPAGDGPHDLVFDFSALPGGYGWLFPKGDHINIGVGAFAPADFAEPPTPGQLKAVTRRLLAAYSLRKLGVADLPHITGQHLGMGGHAYVPRGRVLLTGDAAGLVDPLTGEGIHSAIVSGQAAAAAILETLYSGSTTVIPAEAYARRLAPLQQTLAFSHRAAQSFYRNPARGFRAMRLPILRSLILRTYADGFPHTRLLTALAKLV